ncbi:hypothetical protein NZD89_08985 [Alicyclobacillus fastidiosus]|uniref:Transposase InsH N-terminal domain-containing protein n=1 Tax=Alicyclobacillus fastidiosus TaxID=392011 RepID=A0ABY6ZL18_9BACL|nr:hypothetical protein [Alicyclobacillus fastidiosus]WAH43495.1 hypothetical protein NZD89_08985 [Alicyclobacillus fastidiosus]
MLPILRSHQQYPSFIEERLRLHYSNGSLLFIAKNWALVAKFWVTDLSDTFQCVKGTYSCRGPQSIDPANLLRSYLLMLEVGEPSITKWVNQLRRCPLYAILSGFEYGHTPGVGTFYDFFGRLWNHVSPNIASRRRLSRKKPKRGKKGEKAPTTNPKRIAKLISQLQRRTAIRSQPFDVLLRLFQQQFLSVSSSLGLLGMYMPCPSLVTVCPCKQQPRFVASEFVPVVTREKISAPVIASSHNQTATWAGTATEISFTSATTYTALSLRIALTTYRFTLGYKGLPDTMPHLGS